MPVPNNINTITAETYSAYAEDGELFDAVFNGVRGPKALIAKGSKVRQPGGLDIRVNVQYAKNPNVRWVAEHDTNVPQSYEFVAQATYNWRMLQGDVVVSKQEELRNMQEFEIRDLVKDKIKNTTDTMTDNLGSSFFNDGTDPIAPLGLQALITNTGTLAGIDRGTYTWWQSNVDSTAGVLTVNDMVNMFNLCSHNIASPDIVLTTRTLYGKYEALGYAKYNVIASMNLDLGFETIKFKSMDMFWDDYCPASGMYFVNSKSLKIYCHSDAEMKVLDPVRATNGLDTIHTAIWYGAFVLENPRYHGVLKNRNEGS